MEEAVYATAATAIPGAVRGSFLLFSVSAVCVFPHPQQMPPSAADSVCCASDSSIFN